LPHIIEWQKKYSAKGLVIIGVHTVFGAEHLEDFVKEKGINYPVALDASAGERKGKTGHKYLVDSFPDYYFIDKKGTLRYADCANASAEDAIKELLAEK
jgi:hypothetical protein